MQLLLPPTPTPVWSNKGSVPLEHFRYSQGSACQAPRRPEHTVDSLASPENLRPSSGPPRQRDLHQGTHPTGLSLPGHVRNRARGNLSVCSPHLGLSRRESGVPQEWESGPPLSGENSQHEPLGPSARVRGRCAGRREGGRSPVPHPGPGPTQSSRFAAKLSSPGRHPPRCRGLTSPSAPTRSGGGAGCGSFTLAAARAGPTPRQRRRDPHDRSSAIWLHCGAFRTTRPLGDDAMTAFLLL